MDGPQESPTVRPNRGRQRQHSRRPPNYRGRGNGRQFSRAPLNMDSSRPLDGSSDPAGQNLYQQSGYYHHLNHHLEHQRPQMGNNYNQNNHVHPSEHFEPQSQPAHQATQPGNQGQPRFRSSGNFRGRAGAQRSNRTRNDIENDPSQANHHEANQSHPVGSQQRPTRGRTSNFRYLDRPSSSGQPEEGNLDETQDNDQTKNLEPEPSTSTSTTRRTLPQRISTKCESNLQSEIAEDQLKTNNFECMICCDNINRFIPIWCCSSCYNIFHLKCAIEWCNKSIKSRDDAIANAQYPSLSQPSAVQGGQGSATQMQGYSDYKGERMNSVEWPCPACREVLYSRPGKYKCFCGKVVRPEVNRHLTPHSCGQICGRSRPNADCPHSCNSVCHPGRCAPCPLTSRRSCFCGKVSNEVKCFTGTVSCEQTCDKTLTCGQHKCARICHNGSCGNCEAIVTIKCNCGQEEIQDLCTNLIKSGKKPLVKFSCTKICGKTLDCGKHLCEEKCHPGPDCRSCKLLSKNIRTCPCGSTLIKKSTLAERQSCTDPVPTCDSKCNRPLICGPEKSRHKCQKKCHIGPCPPCKLKTTASCECKLTTKTIECSLMYEKIVDGDHVTFRQKSYTFSCEARCNKLKNCGRHRCYNKCCSHNKNLGAQAHRCDQTCNKKLPCGMHNCPETCHPGQCGDCTNIGWEELTCHCGASVLFPPVPCGARPPACHRICRRAHDCGHPVKHECHDDTEKCPPCTVFVKKSCFCGSDSKDSVYCYLPGYSCGRTCKKQLACRRHACQRVCHDGNCEQPSDRGVILCMQPCPNTRYTCKHQCGIPCHGAVPCPVSECRKILEISCECGNKVERIECYKVTRDVENRNKVAMLSSMSRPGQDSVMIDLTKKSNVSQASRDDQSGAKKKLDCDETCSILKRNKALAEALEISQPDLKPTSIFGEDPLRLLREATVQDYKFVAATYNTLTRFIKSAKESDKRFIFMQFPPANKLRREVIHELARHFNCTSENRDEDPFKHVVVRAYRNKSCTPDFTIEELLPVTD